MKDIIYIKDLRVKTIIGIFDWERKVKQEVSIDMEFPFDCRKAAASDSIEDTTDYKTICKAVIKFVEESSFQLHHFQIKFLRFHRFEEQYQYQEFLH